MKSCLLLMFLLVIFSNNYGQQYVSYNTVQKSSGEVLAASPSRKIRKFSTTHNEGDINATPSTETKISNENTFFPCLSK